MASPVDDVSQVPGDRATPQTPPTAPADDLALRLERLESLLDASSREALTFYKNALEKFYPADVLTKHIPPCSLNVIAALRSRGKNKTEHKRQLEEAKVCRFWRTSLDGILRRLDPPGACDAYQFWWQLRLVAERVSLDAFLPHLSQANAERTKRLDVPDRKSWAGVPDSPAYSVLDVVRAAAAATAAATPPLLGVVPPVSGNDTCAIERDETASPPPEQEQDPEWGGANMPDTVTMRSKRKLDTQLDDAASGTEPASPERKRGKATNGSKLKSRADGGSPQGHRDEISSGQESSGTDDDVGAGLSGLDSFGMDSQGGDPPNPFGAQQGNLSEVDDDVTNEGGQEEDEEEEEEEPERGRRGGPNLSTISEESIVDTSMADDPAPSPSERSCNFDDDGLGGWNATHTDGDDSQPLEVRLSFSSDSSDHDDAPRRPCEAVTAAKPRPHETQAQAGGAQPMTPTSLVGVNENTQIPCLVRSRLHCYLQYIATTDSVAARNCLDGPNQWYNDVVVNTLLSIMTTCVPDSFAFVSSLGLRESAPSPQSSSPLEEKEEDQDQRPALIRACHVGSDHWVLCTMDAKEHVICLYDSLPSEDHTLAAFDQMAGLAREPAALHIQPCACPRQNNGNDCGPYVLGVAACLVTGQNLPAEFDAGLLRNIWRRLLMPLLDNVDPVPADMPPSKNDQPGQVDFEATNMPNLALWLRRYSANNPQPALLPPQLPVEEGAGEGVGATLRDFNERTREWLSRLQDDGQKYSRDMRAKHHQATQVATRCLAARVVSALQRGLQRTRLACESIEALQNKQRDLALHRQMLDVMMQRSDVPHPGSDLAKAALAETATLEAQVERLHGASLDDSKLWPPPQRGRTRLDTAMCDVMLKSLDHVASCLELTARDVRHRIGEFSAYFA